MKGNCFPPSIPLDFHAPTPGFQTPPVEGVAILKQAGPPIGRLPFGFCWKALRLPAPWTFLGHSEIPIKVSASEQAKTLRDMRRGRISPFGQEPSTAIPALGQERHWLQVPLEQCIALGIAIGKFVSLPHRSRV